MKYLLTLLFLITISGCSIKKTVSNYPISGCDKYDFNKIFKIMSEKSLMKKQNKKIGFNK